MQEEVDLIYKLDGVTIKEAIVTLLNYPMGAKINKVWNGDRHVHGDHELLVKEKESE